MDKFIDLGRTYETCAPSDPKNKGSKVKEKISYPTLYISGVEGLDLGTGDVTFTAKGRVISVSKRDTEDKGEQSSVEIEVKSINFPGAKEEDGLDKKLTEIEADKNGIDTSEEE